MNKPNWLDVAEQSGLTQAEVAAERFAHAVNDLPPAPQLGADLRQVLRDLLEDE